MGGNVPQHMRYQIIDTLTLVTERQSINVNIMDHDATMLDFSEGTKTYIIFYVIPAQ